MKDQFFTVTFLGQQGWFFSTGQNHVLVDPLLFDEVGRGPRAARYSLGLRRRFDLKQLPKLDAVILSHEHEDHFDLRSMFVLPKETPIYLSADSSPSAFTILRELGFKTIIPLEAGALLKFGSLCMKFFEADYCNGLDNMDEWGTLAFLVFDDRGNGSFFTNVDIHLTDAMLMFTDHTLRKLTKEKKIKKPLNKNVLQTRSKRLNHCLVLDSMPDTVDPKLNNIPQNKTKLLYDGDSIKFALNSKYPIQPAAGLTISMQNGQVAKVAMRSKFLRGGNYATGRFTTIKRGEPIMGHIGLRPPEWKELERRLKGYAKFLYGNVLFKRFLSLRKEQRIEGRKATFAFILKTTNGKYRVYEYSLRFKRFNLVSDSSNADSYMASCECWAQDLLEALRGTFEARSLTAFHSHWKLIPPVIVEEAVGDLVRYLHPLNQSEAVLRRYRKILTELHKNPPENFE